MEEENSVPTKIGMIVIFGFFFNLLWEVLHSMLYDWDKAPLVNDIYIYIPRIVFYASLYDAFWMFFMVMINSGINRSFKWLYSPQKRDWALLIAGGLAIAIISEISATMIHDEWSYNEYMPQVFGIGLTPLVQLAFTVVLSVYLSTKLKWQKR
ncbi:MAG: hypothetical protein GF383_10460 [Candidatus Lokiarchaeota archaeon]|nr:hypothetical protein [Candidatus Lokiarchaeota archaeon]MBD3340994.1 hypothetical protein [Candidatus Lokiarchaeota archaeon]